MRSPRRTPLHCRTRIAARPEKSNHCRRRFCGSSRSCWSAGGSREASSMNQCPREKRAPCKGDRIASDPIDDVIVETHPAGGGQGDDGASAGWVRHHQPYADWLNPGGSFADGGSRTEQRPPSANAHSAHHCCGPRLLGTLSTQPCPHDALHWPLVCVDRRRFQGRTDPRLLP